MKFRQVCRAVYLGQGPWAFAAEELSGLSRMCSTDEPPSDPRQCPQLRIGVSALRVVAAAAFALDRPIWPQTFELEDIRGCSASSRARQPTSRADGTSSSDSQTADDRRHPDGFRATSAAYRRLAKSSQIRGWVRRGSRVDPRPTPRGHPRYRLRAGAVSLQLTPAQRDTRPTGLYRRRYFEQRDERNHKHARSQCRERLGQLVEPRVQVL